MLNKRESFILIVIAIIGIAGCNRNITCPAFQSQFLIDRKARDEKFSLFKNDSTPKSDGYVKKNKHGLGARKSYVKKTNEMRTITMVKVYPPVKDSIQMLHPTDSARLDTTGAAFSRVMTTTNSDQVFYNAVIGTELAKIEKEEEKNQAKTTVSKDTVVSKQEGTGAKKFKFNLFRKKDKTAEESAQEAQPATKPKPGKQITKPEDQPNNNIPSIKQIPAKTNPADSTNQDQGF